MRRSSRRRAGAAPSPLPCTCPQCKSGRSGNRSSHGSLACTRSPCRSRQARSRRRRNTGHSSSPTRTGLPCRPGWSGTRRCRDSLSRMRLSCRCVPTDCIVHPSCRRPGLAAQPTCLPDRRAKVRARARCPSCRSRARCFPASRLRRSRCSKARSASCRSPCRRRAQGRCPLATEGRRSPARLPGRRRWPRRALSWPMTQHAECQPAPRAKRALFGRSGSARPPSVSLPRQVRAGRRTGP